VSARLFVTTNGPGEVMGWLRPFLRATYQLEPAVDVTVVVLPCAYATGHEAQMVQRLFPAAHVIDRQAYGNFLIGRRVPGMQRTSGALQYLGGDLFHAVTIAKRLNLVPMTYKFTKRSYARVFARFFALDEHNAQTLRAEAAPPDRVRVVGNLVYDAVMGSLTAPARAPGVGSGVCIMPGSRPYETKFLTPFFLAVAQDLQRLRPGEQITFVIPPFTTDEELRAAVRSSGDPKLFGIAGRFDADRNIIAVDGMRFAVDRSGNYRTLAGTQLVISIPGTKCMEAAVLGRPLLVAIPLNRLDEIAMNGVGAYLHHIPLIGRPLKTWLVRTVARRFVFMAQPNIDAGREIAPEIRGILRPPEVAEKAAALLANPPELLRMGSVLGALYAPHAGAAERMASEALNISARLSAQPVAV
jgi:hypothetical protein